MFLGEKMFVFIQTFQSSEHSTLRLVFSRVKMQPESWLIPDGNYLSQVISESILMAQSLISVLSFHATLSQGLSQALQ